MVKVRASSPTAAARNWPSCLASHAGGATVGGGGGAGATGGGSGAGALATGDTGADIATRGCTTAGAASIG